MTTFFKSAALSVCALTLGACSTLGGIGDTISDINPFDRSEENAKKRQGEVAGESERISILELNENLSVSGTITPDQIVLPPPYVNTDWPQIGGNAAHVVQHTGASGPLERIWSKRIGDGSSRKGRVLAPPIIANGVIYTMDADNTVRAYNEASGDRLWDYKVSVEARERTREGRSGIVETIRDPLSILDGSGRDKESVGGGISVSAGKLFISSGLGVIAALDAETGAPIWATPTRTPLHSGPTSSGGRVFAVSDDNELFALNADTGAVLWTYQGLVESARMLTVPAPAVIDDVVLAPFSSGELVALRVQNGGVLWQDALSSSARLTPLASLNDIASGPVIADGYAIATAQSGVMTAYDFRTGQRVWSQPAGALGFPLIAGDFVYTVTTDGKVAALSKLDGSVVWVEQLPLYKKEKKRKDRINWTGPILAGGRLVVASSRGGLVLLDPLTGSILREDKIGGEVFIPPVIANETVYLITNDAKLIALR